MSKSRKSPGSTGKPALPFLLLIVLAAVVAGYWYGTRQEPQIEPPRNSVTITTPQFDPGQNDVVNVKNNVPVKPGEDPIRQAVEAQLAAKDGKGVSAFPTGTKLVGISVKDGTVILELSTAFKDLNKGGSSQQSLAQNALRSTLAQFSTVKRMRVLVDGKVFEDEHSGEWAEIDVRDDNARAEGQP